MSTNTILSKHEDVVELATKIGQDIGGVANLETTDKTSVVGAINEVLTASVSLEISMENDFAKKTDLTPLAKKTDLTPLAKKTDLTPLATKTAVAKDIGDLANLVTTNKTNVVSAINEVYNGAVELGTSIGELENAVDAEFARKTELTPLATKAHVSKDIGDLANLPTDDKTSVVASINEIVNDFVLEGFQELTNKLLYLETEGEDTYAKKTDLSSLVSMDDFSQGLAGLTEDLFIAIGEDFATKDELTQAITDLINGADADSDTLKELADKITALAQADKGLVSAGSAQSFNATQKKRARDNIGAISEAEVSQAFTDLGNNAGGGYVSAYLQASQ